jgi:hypothetical protein
MRYFLGYSSKKCWIIFLLIIFLQCESNDKYYRPNIPQQICAIGLIDIDDTLSYDICYDDPRSTCYTCGIDSSTSTKKIYFEKSNQTDNPDNTEFSHFDFEISNGIENVFAYHMNQPTKNLNVEIPANIQFEAGRKYYFHACEEGLSDVTAECTIPDLPPEPFLVSLKTGFSILDLPKEGCYFWKMDQMIGFPHREDTTTYTRRYAEIEFSFISNNPESYYTFFLIGTPPGSRLKLEESSPGFYKSNFLNFKLLETNTDGFYYNYKGGRTMQHYCEELIIEEYSIRSQYYLQCKSDTIVAYFIDGSKIPGGTCTIKIFVEWDNVQYIPSFIKYFHVRLMSLPKEAYLFYKSLHTIKTEGDDPFGELVNINGNITGGNGIIALCRSRDLIVNTGQTGGMYDPFF